MNAITGYELDELYTLLEESIPDGMPLDPDEVYSFVDNLKDKIMDHIRTIAICQIEATLCQSLDGLMDGYMTSEIIAMAIAVDESPDVVMVFRLASGEEAVEYLEELIHPYEKKG